MNTDNNAELEPEGGAEGLCGRRQREVLGDLCNNVNNNNKINKKYCPKQTKTPNSKKLLPAAFLYFLLHGFLCCPVACICFAPFLLTAHMSFLYTYVSGAFQTPLYSFPQTVWESIIFSLEQNTRTRSLV